LKLIRGLTIALLAVLGLLGALEVAARVFYVPPTSPPARDYVPGDPKLRELTFWELDKPNARGLSRGVLFETNRMRLRSPERPLEKPPGTTRIAVLGDSFVMGEGVLAEESYVWRLEQEMTRVRPGRYETINTGLSGLNAAQAVKRVLQLGLAYDPDIAVYGFTLNDIEGPRYVKSYEYSRDQYRVESSPFRLWRIAGPGYVAFRERFFPPFASYARELRFNAFENEPAWTDFTAALDQLARISKDRGICTVLFIHTQLVTLNALHPFTSIYDKVADAARERGFLTISSLAAFLGRPEKALWVSSADSHPNPEGHRLLAETLADGLAGLPPECFR
jgi:lysophospholipase L1-like esterase